MLTVEAFTSRGGVPSLPAIEQDGTKNRIKISDLEQTTIETIHLCQETLCRLGS